MIDRGTLRILACMVATGALISVGNASPATTTSSKNGRIFFASVEHGDNYNWDIYSVNEDGTDLSRLTDHPIADWAPAVSPDGTKVAFVSWRDYRERIYVMRSDGSNVRPLRARPNTREGGRIAWSPDGTRIVFPGERRHGWIQLYSIRADRRAGQRQITRVRGDARDPNWSPNGKRLVFAVTHQRRRPGSDRVTDLFTIRPDGTGLRRITRGANAYEPVWAPNGRRIAFTSARAMGTSGAYRPPCRITLPESDPAYLRCETDIYSIREDGSDERQLTDSAGWDAQPTWAPDGRSIVFLSDRAGSFAAWLNDLFVMDADGENERLLLTTEGWEWGLSWQRLDG